MIDPRISKALEHTDPAIRKKAIVALGKSQDKNALPILAKVFKNDPDPDVRHYARKAGQYIHSLQQTPAPVVPVVPAEKPIPPPVQQDVQEAVIEKPIEQSIQKSTEKPVQETKRNRRDHKPSQKPKPIAKPVQVYVSQGEIEQAEQYVSLGFQSFHIGEMIDAEKLFRKAFDTNPNLINDSYVVEAVHKLFDKKTPEESVEVLLKVNYSAHIVYSTHANERMEQRRVTEAEVISAVEGSDEQILEDDGDTRFIKSIRRFDGQMRPLNVVAKPLETKSRVRDKWLIKTVYVRGEDDDGYIKPAKSPYQSNRYRNNNRNYRQNNNKSYNQWNKKSYNKHRGQKTEIDFIFFIVIILFVIAFIILYSNSR